jgi:hypothetical protein
MDKDEELAACRRKIAELNLTLTQLNAECVQIYGLLAMAHLNIKQHLEFGFTPNTARSTLISVGQYYPKLKVEMEKQHERTATGRSETGAGGVAPVPDGPYSAPIKELWPVAPKPWVGLTTEEIYACDETSGLPQHEITNADLQAFAYAIEAKLKEKNT